MADPQKLEPTPRELEVLRLVAKDLSNNEIAKILGIDERTVRFHLSNIFKTLKVKGRAGAVAQAIQAGWSIFEEEAA